MKTPTTTFENISPELAAKYLATNSDHQRNVTHSHVVHLSQQMEKGQWQMNGESIIFDDQGRLIDGQHRLLAIIMSGMTLIFLVVRGVASNSFHSIDRGKIRSNGNIFAIDGVPNYNIVASATAGVINYRRAIVGKSGKAGSLNSWIRASTEDMIQEYRNHPDTYQFAARISMNCRKKLPPAVTSTVAALSVIDAGHNTEFVAHFWSLVESGIGLSEKDPILHFRNRIESNSASKSKMGNSMLITLAIKAWNLYSKSKSCGVIRLIDGEPCPEIE